MIHNIGQSCTLGTDQMSSKLGGKPTTWDITSIQLDQYPDPQQPTTTHCLHFTQRGTSLPVTEAPLTGWMACISWWNVCVWGGGGGVGGWVPVTPPLPNLSLYFLCIFRMMLFLELPDTYLKFQHGLPVLPQTILESAGCAFLESWGILE